MSQDTFAARSLWRRYVIDRNPFYLLSAICMLSGCVALTNSSSWTSIPLNRLIILIATLNIYEAILISLAMFLMLKRRLRRDGNILLIIEAFFLVDVTFLNSEVFTRNIKIGLLVNSLLFLLAIAKSAGIFRAMRLPIRSGSFIAILISMLVLFATPGVFKQLASHRNGVLRDTAIYAVWWVIGFLIPMSVILMRNRRGYDSPMYRALSQARGVLILLATLPILSLIAHISTSNWIYGVPWHWTNLSPMLLGIGLACGVSDSSVYTRSMRAAQQFWIPVLAVFFSFENPDRLFFIVGHIHFSPTRLTVLMTMLVYLHGLILHRRAIFGLAIGACMAAAGLGTSMEEIMTNLQLMAEQVCDFVRKLLPKSQTDWGVISLVAAFGLLVVGAAISLSKPIERENHET